MSYLASRQRTKEREREEVSTLAGGHPLSLATERANHDS